MSAISRISTNTPWEPIVGYSRLVRAGDIVAVSGTTATDERGLIVGGGQMYVQARKALDNIRAVLEQAGVGMDQVIRTRMFVTDMERFSDVARAHKEFFGECPPASSVVEVCRLAHPDMMIEIEADAYAGAATAQTASAKRAATESRPAKKVARKPASKKKPARRK